MTEHSRWAYWQNALQGVFGPVHENEPQIGFYRVKDDPVAIYEAGGALVALRGTKAVLPSEVWTYACKRPISHALYKEVVAGGPWPESIDREIAAVAPAGIGHNSGEPHEVALDELDALERAWSSWLQSIGGKVDTEDQDAKADTFQKRFHDLMKKADEQREALKRPHLEAGRLIDATWKPVITHADTAKRRIGEAVLPYRKARDEARRAAERAAAEEAARKRREHEAAVAAAAAAAAPMPEPPPPEPVQAARPAKKGFREVKVLVITDLAKACASILKHDRENPDLENAVRVVSRRLIEAGLTVEGAEIRLEQRA